MRQNQAATRLFFSYLHFEILGSSPLLPVVKQLHKINNQSDKHQFESRHIPRQIDPEQQCPHQTSPLRSSSSSSLDSLAFSSGEPAPQPRVLHRTCSDLERSERNQNRQSKVRTQKHFSWFLFLTAHKWLSWVLRIPKLLGLRLLLLLVKVLLHQAVFLKTVTWSCSGPHAPGCSTLP